MPSPPARSRRHGGGRGGAALAAALAAVLAAALLAPAAAQPVLRDDERLDFDRPEAWAMKYFASVTLFSGFGVAEPLAPGAVEAAFEVGWIPRLDDDEAQVGFRGSKVEDVNKAPLFVRPRLAVGLPAEWTLTVGYVPPVEAFDVEANILSLALGRPLGAAGGWRFGGRLYAQSGTIESDVTCPDEVAGVRDFRRNPSQCDEPSRDAIGMDYAGVEVAAAYGPPAARWRPYAALAANYLDLEFQVDALTNGLRDLSRLTADGWTWSAAAGLGWHGGDGLEVAVEAYYTPLAVDRDLDGSSATDALFHLRTVVRWRPR